MNINTKSRVLTKRFMFHTFLKKKNFLKQMFHSWKNKHKSMKIFKPLDVENVWQRLFHFINYAFLWAHIEKIMIKIIFILKLKNIIKSQLFIKESSDFIKIKVGLQCKVFFIIKIIRDVTSIFIKTLWYQCHLSWSEQLDDNHATSCFANFCFVV